MKIIDLINMAANDKVDVYKTYFMFGDEKYNLYKFFDSYVLNFTSLNFEIEIIEDTSKEEKKIPEKIQKDDFEGINEEEPKLWIAIRKINEIIDYLKSKGE